MPLTFFLLSVLVFAFLILRLLITLTNFLQNPKLPEYQTETPDNEALEPLVSILIPARNEAHNLPRTLRAVQRQAYRHLEVLVLDDHSEDGTAEIIEDFTRQDRRIRRLSGTSLPSGWLGKNWACDQLAALAQGDYFLFIDADVELHGEAIRSAIQELKRQKLVLLSVFPDQEMPTWGEKIVVPIMHYLLLTLLPLAFIRRFAFPSMAAANGQFMLFEAATYRREQWHERVRQRVTEDIEIVKVIKRQGLRAGTYLGNRMIRCRMYDGFGAAVDGFSKNLLAGFGNSILGLLVFLLLTTVGYGFALWYAPLLGGAMLVVGTTIINLLLAAMGNQPLVIVLLQPLKMLALVGIGFNSIYRKLSGKNTWKGRRV